MNGPRLEDHLHRLADDLEAPATSTARQAIGHRARALRRRRQVRSAAGAGVVLVVAVVAGALSLRGDPDVKVQPAEPPAEGALTTLPAVTVEVDGWEVVAADESADVATDRGSIDDPNWVGAYQVFRRSGELVGPTVFVTHEPQSDVDQEPAGQEIAVGSATGYLSRVGDSVSVRWNPQIGDTAASLQAWDLTNDEVSEFANGLVPKDDSIGYPSEPDDDFEFDVTEHPQGIDEDPIDPVSADRADVRHLTLESGDGRAIDIRIDNRGERGFEAGLDRFTGWDSIVPEIALGHPAVLLHSLADNEWVITWRHNDTANVTVTAAGVDRETVTQIVDGLREISEDDWQSLLASHG